MREEIHTIPIEDAFSKDCECPVCEMYRKLEENAINFTVGPCASYMESDIREQSDAQGFCQKHFQKLYTYPNKLGLALILKTHMDKTVNDLEKAAKAALPKPNALFKKKEIQPHAVTDYITAYQKECFVCSYIHRNFDRYIVSIFRLYEKEADFRVKFASSKGFCIEHYKVLFEKAPAYLSKKYLEEFLNVLNQLFLENFKRVRDDLEWFIQKNDYRFRDAPWKNGQDALPRALTKVGSIWEEGE
ncbi:MAG: hypothetical protein J6A92_02740 [Lachnospiraceae bacterium]|nr:hypothetical protein [Lachnospiraceae bacterium]